MRVPAILLLVFVTLLAKTSGEDLYLEGDDSANEFLEVNEDSGFGSSFHRLKRQLTTSVNRVIRAVVSSTPLYDYNTEDPDIGEDDDTDDFEPDGETISSIDLEPKEKTVRVTFVVMEPYQPYYSNRDSPVFQNFSTSLANAVNDLLRDLPGDHKTSLVRIQSRPTDEFSCKVTLDIASIGFEDTDTLTKLLRDQIRNRGKLGQVIVSDADFSATVSDAGYPPTDTCAGDEFQCDGNDICLPASLRCNKEFDCSDRSDEEGCPTDQEESYDVYQATESAPATYTPCVSWSCPKSLGHVICNEKRCDGAWDCPEGEDENDCNGDDIYNSATSEYEAETSPEAVIPERPQYYTTTPYSVDNTICDSGDFKCDETRCIPASSRCDGRKDCHDNTDEAGCPNVDIALKPMIKL